MVACTVEEALAFLQKKSTTNGDTVFSHLSSLIQHVLETKAEDAVDLLETSMLLKQTRFLLDETTKPIADGKYPNEEKVTRAFLELFNATTKSPPDPEAETDGQEEAAEAESDADIADFLTQSSFFKAVGVGVGCTETYLIVLAMRQLGLKSGVTTVRFFGKFFGTSGNYYVFETNKLEDEQTESESGTENKPPFGRPIETIPPEREGTNAHLYWVCGRLGETFTRLPDVMPLQIKTARSIRRFLTGKLDEEVSAYPPFPGLEKNYLRAQIARIAGNTILAPKGYFVVEEPEEEEEYSEKIEKNEEWAMPSPSELGTLEAWVHQNPHIKKQGRCSLYVAEPEPPEEGEEEEDAEGTPKAQEEPEQSPKLLTSIDNDEDVLNGTKSWSVSFSSDIKGLKHRIVCVRSLLWPGAYAVATKDGFSNVYIGWGVKNAPYDPPLPPEVQMEYHGELVESEELPPIPRPEATEEPTESEAAEHEQEEEEEEEA